MSGRPVRPKQPAPSPPGGFTDFVMSRSAALYRTAVLLTRDPHGAQDLLQRGLAQGWRHWDRIERGEPEAYIRRVIVNQFLADRSRRRRGEQPTEHLPDRPVHDRLVVGPRDPATQATEQTTLVDAIDTLPPRQRAVVVLRYFHDLTEAQTADLMGTSVGTVKSQHSKALSALRISEHLTDSSADADVAGRRNQA